MSGRSGIQWSAGLLVVLGAAFMTGDGCSLEIHYPERARSSKTRPSNGSPGSRGANSSKRGALSREVRAVWVTRWDYLSKTDVRNLVKNCSSLGLNRIYFQVRGQADAFYKSSLEPWGEDLNGNPGYDPLSIAIDEAHRQNIELFAWINVLPAWKGTKPPKNKKHVYYTHPEWFLKNRNGNKNLLNKDRYALLNPCLPEVRDYLVKIVNEIATNYAIDGLQFDYIRFLTRNVKKGEDVPYDSPTLARFRKQSGGFPTRFPTQWDRFRKNALNLLVKEMSKAVRDHRSNAVLSVAAIKDLELARNHLFQDVVHWSNRGWIDEVCPMIYTPEHSTFQNIVKKLTRALPSHQIIPGIGLYMIPPREALKQILLARKQNARGYALFSYTSLFLSRSPHSSRAPDIAELRAKNRKMLTRVNRFGVKTARIRD